MSAGCLLYRQQKSQTSVQAVQRRRGSGPRPDTVLVQRAGTRRRAETKVGRDLKPVAPKGSSLQLVFKSDFFKTRFMPVRCYG